MDPKQALTCWIEGRDLSFRESRDLFAELVDGAFDDIMVAGLLGALAAKGESTSEIGGAAAVLRSRCVAIPTRRDKLVDTCGTGGDGKGSFNISTAAAIVAAAADVAVAKHGNRSVSSRSGSADVLEAAGVEVETSPASAGRALDELGIAFLYAPRLHPAMARVMPVRRTLGVRTIFNILGPLVNPAGARRQVLGVFDDSLVAKVAQVLADLGCDHGLVVRGSDGLDELTTTGSSLVAEIRGHQIDTYTIAPQDVGLPRADPESLVGGSPHHNAALLLEVLNGGGGPLTDITVLNAGAAVYVGGKAADLPAGIARAQEVIRSGAARAKLEALRRFHDWSPEPQ